MLSQLANFFITPVFAQADDYGLSATAGAADLAKYGTSLPGLIGNVLGTALSLVGVLFFALMLFGGVTWMLAHGNAEQEKKALNTIVAAIIGILIVLGSYALTTFVFKSVGSSGTPTTPPPTPTGSCVVNTDEDVIAEYCAILESDVCEAGGCSLGSGTCAPPFQDSFCTGKKDGGVCKTIKACKWE